MRDQFPTTLVSQASFALLIENDTPQSFHKPAQGVSRNGFVIFIRVTGRTERALFAHARPHHSRDVTPRSASAGRCAASVILLQSPAMSAHRQPESTTSASRGSFVVNGGEPKRGNYLTRARGFASEATPNDDGNRGEAAEATLPLGKVCACLQLWKQSAFL